MRITRFRFELVDGPIEQSPVAEWVAGPDAGCILTFAGTVRDQANNKEVLRLEYEAYPEMVERELSQIVDEVCAAQPILRVAVQHSRGAVSAGQTSVVLAIASAHRAAAFAAGVQLMDELKKRVPIWKREVYSDGSSWLGQGS